jgi:hypothetical protein
MYQKLTAKTTPSREHKIINEDKLIVARAIIAEGYASRFVSCWNACLHFDDPEADIKKLVEALKTSRARIHNEIRHHSEAGSYREMLQSELKEVEEALASYKE